MQSNEISDQKLAWMIAEQQRWLAEIELAEATRLADALYAALEAGKREYRQALEDYNK